MTGLDLRYMCIYTLGRTIKPLSIHSNVLLTFVMGIMVMELVKRQSVYNAEV